MLHESGMTLRIEDLSREIHRTKLQSRSFSLSERSLKDVELMWRILCAAMPRGIEAVERVCGHMSDRLKPRRKLLIHMRAGAMFEC